MISLMAPSTRTFPLILKVSHVVLLITVVFIFSLTILPPKPVLGFDQYSSQKRESISEEKRKMVLGSRPPGCVNKCLNCRPCTATLVIPSHQKLGFEISSSHGEDDSYYLLSWKCRCGNKLFEP